MGNREKLLALSDFIKKWKIIKFEYYPFLRGEEGEGVGSRGIIYYSCYGISSSKTCVFQEQYF